MQAVGPSAGRAPVARLGFGSMGDAGGLTVAVTGPTGTFGLALMPLL